MRGQVSEFPDWTRLLVSRMAEHWECGLLSMSTATGLHCSCILVACLLTCIHVCVLMFLHLDICSAVRSVESTLSAMSTSVHRLRLSRPALGAHAPSCALTTELDSGKTVRVLALANAPRQAVSHWSARTDSTARTGHSRQSDPFPDSKEEPNKTHIGSGAG